MKEFLISLSVMSIGGLFFLAYNHPKFFEKIFKKLYFSILILFGFYATYSISKTLILKKVISKYSNDKFFKRVLYDLSNQNQIVLIIFICTCALLIGLSFLRDYIDKRDN